MHTRQSPGPLHDFPQSCSIATSKRCLAKPIRSPRIGFAHLPFRFDFVRAPALFPEPIMFARTAIAIVALAAGISAASADGFLPASEVDGHAGVTYLDLIRLIVPD